MTSAETNQPESGRSLLPPIDERFKPKKTEGDEGIQSPVETPRKTETGEKEVQLKDVEMAQNVGNKVAPSEPAPDSKKAQVVAKNEAPNKKGTCCQKKKKKPQKPKDRMAEKLQTKLLMSIVWEQKWILFMATPFMFVGGITDFLFPNLIAQVIDAMKEQDKALVYYNLKVWLVIIAIGAVSTMLNSYLFGLTSQRLGRALRNRLFKALLKKDIAFYDECRTGDLRKSFFQQLN